MPTSREVAERRLREEYRTNLASKNVGFTEDTFVESNIQAAVREVEGDQLSPRVRDAVDRERATPEYRALAEAEVRKYAAEQFREMKARADAEGRTIPFTEADWVEAAVMTLLED